MIYATFTQNKNVILLYYGRTVGYSLFMNPDKRTISTNTFVLSNRDILLHDKKWLFFFPLSIHILEIMRTTSPDISDYYSATELISHTLSFNGQ